MVTIHKAGALIIKNKRLLIVKPKGKPFYINPGGKYESGESAEKCLKRELNEELKVKVTACRHFKDYNISKAAHSKLPLHLRLYFVSIKGKPAPCGEIESYKWLSKEDFEKKKYNLASSFYKFVPDLISENSL